MRMPKRGLVTRLVAPMALVLGVSLTGAPNASGAGADVFGVGGGSINFGGSVKVAKFAFSGHTGPNGDFGSFRFTVEDPSVPLDAHVNVDCVNVLSESARRRRLDRRGGDEGHSAAEHVRH